MLPTESGRDIGEDSECKPGSAAERRGEPRAVASERCACELVNCEVRTGEASKVPDSLELPSWSLVKPEGVRLRRRATRACELAIRRRRIAATSVDCVVPCAKTLEVEGQSLVAGHWCYFTGFRLLVT
ncbi:hypothetical protein FH972_017626 [Carpinus fangiana]|uniref:Uncharacterized protein n=1 Tax=Carpinus fangiana TaxID=176857 RepID=A0A5N6RMX6_9ROSI|nr:hypothetical protein FH972_017626 [Carpinus fangiana]